MQIKNLNDYFLRIQLLLENIIPDMHDDLTNAMRYSLLSGGKRLRPLLVYAAGACVDAPLSLLDNAALAVECIHAYSLIHDDLPDMDNSPLRHNKSTCHLQFNSGIAILAGDALQSLAFEILAKNSHIASVKILAHAIGAQGMVLGQSLDLQAEKVLPNLTQLQKIHRYKTGALITAALQLGVYCGNHNETIFRQLTQLGEKLGLAFQIQDDILDIESSTQLLGKMQGQDRVNNKATYPELLGLNAAKQLLTQLWKEIREVLMPIENGTLLSALIDKIRVRKG